MSQQDSPGPRAPWSRTGSSGTPGDHPSSGEPGPRSGHDDAGSRTGHDGPGDAGDRSRTRTRRELQHEVVAAEKEEFGGMKLGSAFFGWLAATGMAVLLAAVAAAAGAAAGTDVQSSGVVGAVVAAVVLFVAYFCGGYVAGRMARFSGAKQGVAVWLWAVVAAVALAVVALLGGDRLELPGLPGGVPGLPGGEEQAVTAGVVALVAGALVALLGAVLGGLAGMRFHRRVDRVGVEHRSASVR